MSAARGRNRGSDGLSAVAPRGILAFLLLGGNRLRASWDALADYRSPTYSASRQPLSQTLTLFACSVLLTK